jgi:O-antigen/teichoic acid export membrane protein
VNVLRQSAWFTSDTLANAGAQVLLAGWLIDQRGLALYGFWATTQALVNLAGIAGFSMAAGLALSVQDASPAHHRGWLRAASCLSTPGSGLILGLAALMLWQTTDADADATGQFVFSIPLCAAMLCWAIGNDTAQLASSVLRGSDRYGTAARIGVASAVAQAVCVGALATAGADLPVLAGAAASLALLRAVLMIAAIPRLPPTAADADLPRLSKRLVVLWRFARWQGLRATSSVVMATVDRLIVGQLLGSAALAVYTVCVMIAEAIHRLFAAMLQPAMQWAGRRRRSGQSVLPDRPWFLLIQSAVIAAGLSSMAIAPLLLPWLLGEHAADAVPLLWIAIAAATLSAFHLMPILLLTGGGRNRISAQISLVGAAAALTAILLLAAHGTEPAMAGRLLYGLTLFACWPALRRSQRR